MATKTSSNPAYTLEEFIRLYTTEDILVNSFFFKQVFDPEYSNQKKLIVADTSIIDKYTDELNSNIKKIELTTKEYNKYKYNPKLLSFDLYGTTELWFLILRANELYTSSEFNFRIVKLYDTSILNKMSRIIDVEKPFIDINIEEVDTALNN